MRRGWLVAAGATVVVVVLAVVAGFRFLNWFSSPTLSSDGSPSVSVAVTDVATGLRSPWGLAFRPDGTALVSERDTGRVVEVRDGRVTEVARLDSRHRGEGGLLGIALSPDGWLYAYYTTADDNRIVRLRPGAGGSPEVLVTGIPAAGIHNGGRLEFGPDGSLYAGTGDADRTSRAQDRDDLGGKILRMTPEGRPAPGNPFGTLVWSYGHRNVQGFGWASDGTMYASEFGQNRYDELNRIEAGRNYGWPEVEGDSDRFTRPLATWTTADASPSGLAVIGDRVHVAGLRGRTLWRVTRDGGSAERLLDDAYGRLRTVAQAPDGSVWVVTSNTDGRGDPRNGDDRILRFTP
ncbi:PQQ-dependent sugar dehydrogenase [Virgisporangium ochraceum]